MRKILLTLLVVLTALPALASFSYTYEGTELIYEYVSDSYGDEVYVYKCDYRTSGSVIIPEYVYSYRVTSIRDYAFNSCTGLTSVTIPNSVTSIGRGTFNSCSGLTSVNIPNSVTSIGEATFYGCSGLTSVNIPNSVTSIGNYAFCWCSGLTSVTFPNSVSSIGDYAFGGCSGLTSVTFPNSVTSIGEAAFNSCTGLTSVTIPNSVTSIGEYAFYGCSGLTSVNIPNSVTSIGEATFYGCSGLTSVNIPNSVTSIGNYAFCWCSGLTSVTIPNSVSSIELAAFGRCSGLTSVNIPNSVTSIGEATFFRCTGLTSVTIPNSVTSIGDSTFCDCSGLTSVIIPSSVKSIGAGAFSGCTGLIKSAYPDNMSNPFGNGIAIAYPAQGTVIENGVVADQTTIYFAPVTLTGEYTVADNIKTIHDRAFSLCKNITYIRMPATLSSIGKSAFNGCNLYDFTIPNSVKVFDMESLAGNPLKSLVVGSGVTHIIGSVEFYTTLEKIFWLGNIPPAGYERFIPTVNFVSNDQYHFSNQILYPFLSSIFEVGGIVYVPVSPSERTCNVVDYIYTPSHTQFSVPATTTKQGIQLNVIDIGAYAFYHHDYLIDVSLDNHGVIDDYAFFDCLKLKSVTFGNHITEIKNHTFQNCEVLERVENSPALTSIGKWAFSGCVGMNYFSVLENIESFGEEAFSDCTGLTKFYSYATTPPVCGAQALDDIIKWNCTLYVPIGCENLYASAPQWKDFFYIEGTAGIGTIFADERTDADTEIYDLKGIKQTKGIEDLRSGVYIIRRGSEVTKQVVK